MAPRLKPAKLIILIPATINDNLYAAGSNVSIAGVISGDLFVAGANVIISGPVYADLAAAGGSLTSVEMFQATCGLLAGTS